jgi:hypothetical protein
VGQIGCSQNSGSPESPGWAFVYQVSGKAAVVHPPRRDDGAVRHVLTACHAQAPQGRAAIHYRNQALEVMCGSARGAQVCVCREAHGASRGMRIKRGAGV